MPGREEAKAKMATWDDIVKLKTASPIVNVVLTIHPDMPREQQLIAMVIGYEAWRQEILMMTKLKGTPAEDLPQ